jgi:hypothetical protein
MPAIAPIVINDGAATPVAHTFTPIGRDSDGVFWFEQTTPAPVNQLGAKKIGYKQSRGKPNGQNLQNQESVVSYTLHVPTLEVLSNNSAGFTPAPTLAYKEIARIEFRLAERGLKQERDDTRSLAFNLLQSAMVVANVDDLQPSYA